MLIALGAVLIAATMTSLLFSNRERVGLAEAHERMQTLSDVLLPLRAASRTYRSTSFRSSSSCPMPPQLIMTIASGTLQKTRPTSACSPTHWRLRGSRGRGERLDRF